MLTLEEIQKFMCNLGDWSLEGNSISKVFMFPDFKESLDFLNKVGEASDKMNHHPDVIISGGSVKLTLKTHTENALTEKDFKLAEEIDKLLN
jgi:4a-hydroxytetrahydrobiopterin dehydratase